MQIIKHFGNQPIRFIDGRNVINVEPKNGVVLISAVEISEGKAFMTRAIMKVGTRFVYKTTRVSIDLEVTKRNEVISRI